MSRKYFVKGLPFTESINHNHRFAFTLAEVLITLGVIGVVAAITLPVLIQNHQKTEVVNSLKKMYSTLLQAAQSYQADNDAYITEFDTSLSPKDFMEKYFNPYLKIIKTCDSTETCWQGEKTPKAIDGTTNINVAYGVILSDGSILAIGISDNSNIKVFYFDLNGVKGKNHSGHDIFNFYLLNMKLIHTEVCTGNLNFIKSGIYPGGYASCYTPFTNYDRAQLLGIDIHRSCNKNTTYIDGKAGDACAALIMMDGWKIAPDYPW